MHNSLTEEQFALLPSAAKRVEIAKDVIMHLETDKILAMHSGYASIPDVFNIRKWSLDTDVRDVINAAQHPCAVCALGAIFIADVIKRDNLSIAKYESMSGSTNVRDKVKDYFEDEQLSLIETAYEKTCMGAILPNSWEAVAFGRSIQSANERLVAIMENIIENYGTFVPKIKKEGAI